MNLLYPASYVLILLGLLFAVVPILPGTVLVWLGILAWADANGFQTVGWPLLIVLAVIAVVTLGSDFYMTTLISRRSGASWQAVLGAIVGGLLGGLALSAAALFIGTILGGIAGSVLGVVAVEYLRRRDLRLSVKAGSGFLLGYLASTLLRLAMCLLMIGIFALQALR